MKRYIRAAKTLDDFKIMLKQYKHRQDFNNCDDAELADLLDDLKHKGVAHDIYQHKKGGGCTVFYDDVTGSEAVTVVGSEPAPEYALYQNKKNKNKYIEVKRSADGHSWFRPFVYWNTDRGPVKNYSGSKTNRGRYHRATKDTLTKVLDEYTQVDEVHTDYDDPVDLMSSASIQAATSQRMTDFQLEHLLELADDMLYQVHENYRYDDYSRKDIIDMVIEHVIMVITEMDDDGVYEDLVPFASTSNRQFMKNLKEHLNEMYDTYEWGV